MLSPSEWYEIDSLDGDFPASSRHLKMEIDSWWWTNARMTDVQFCWEWS